MKLLELTTFHQNACGILLLKIPQNIFHAKFLTACVIFFFFLHQQCAYTLRTCYCASVTFTTRTLFFCLSAWRENGHLTKNASICFLYWQWPEHQTTPPLKIFSLNIFHKKFSWYMYQNWPLFPFFCSAGMASHPPIPISELADHTERLKANDNLKFSQEYEVGMLIIFPWKS